MFEKEFTIVRGRECRFSRLRNTRQVLFDLQYPFLYLAPDLQDSEALLLLLTVLLCIELCGGTVDGVVCRDAHEQDEEWEEHGKPGGNRVHQAGELAGW